MIWKGSSKDAGILREVNCTAEAEAQGLCKIDCQDVPNCHETYFEFLASSHPTFDKFRCMTDNDLNRVIDLALRECNK